MSFTCSPGDYYENTHCGYCGNNTSSLYGFHCIESSTSDYQQLIDRGFRRSGRYLYKPNLKYTCCPQYTIRLDVDKYKPSRNSRKKWNKVYSCSEDRKKEFNFNDLNSNRLLVTELDDGQFTPEKFQLYKKYQMKIHNDKEEDCTIEGFKRFLCESPFNDSQMTGPDIHKKRYRYGLHHQLYYMNTKFIAFGVVDILPSGISSVYFVWDPDYAQYSLGTISSMTEIGLAKRFGLSYYYLGYYIHNCTKMAYKGQYKPSFLLDPDWQNFSEEAKWYPIEDYKEEFDKGRKYFSFCEMGKGEGARKEPIKDKSEEEGPIDKSIEKEKGDELREGAKDDDSDGNKTVDEVIDEEEFQNEPADDPTAELTSDISPQPDTALYRFQHMPGRISSSVKLNKLLRSHDVNLQYTNICMTSNKRTLDRTYAQHTISLRQIGSEKYKNDILNVLKELASFIGPELVGRLQLGLLAG